MPARGGNKLVLSVLAAMESKRDITFILHKPYLVRDIA